MVSDDYLRYLRILRRSLLGILLLGLLGAGVELLLLEHTEGVWQKVPLILIAISVAVVAALLIVPRASIVRIMRATMALCVVGGMIGLYLHFDGNREFELEMVPSLSGMALFRATLMGATPALAPGMMIQLGLLGLACTYRHPALASGQNQINEHAPEHHEIHKQPIR